MADRAFTDAEEEQIAKIYEAGHSERAIARVYPAGRTAIQGALRRQDARKRTLRECYELHNRMYSLNPHKFDSIDNEGAAYWLGFLMADGSLSGCNLQLSLKGSDAPHLQRFLDFMESDTPIHHYRVKDKYPAAKVELTHYRLAPRLRELGLVSGRPNPLRPTRILDDDVRHHFIRGYWDGDGTACSNPNDGIHFCGPKPMMAWIRDTIASLSGDLDGNRNLKQHTVSSTSYLLYSGRNVALSAFNVMFSDATIFLPRKRDRVLGWPPPIELARDEMGRYYVPSHLD